MTELARFFPSLMTVFTIVALIAAPGIARDFLTDKEIEAVQQAQEIDLRVKIYLAAAESRLKAADERLVGTEPEPGDPLEFFTPEDMLDSYYKILNSVMLNLDEAFRKRQDVEKIRKALKSLRNSTEKTETELEILKKRAEEKDREELWHLVNKAIDITKGANEGAEYGLSEKLPSPAR